MKDQPFQPDRRDFSAEQGDPVWDLIAKSPRPEPDAWFTVRTLARCRMTAAANPLPALERIWRWALGTGLGVCVAVLLAAVLLVQPPAAARSDSIKQKGVQEAFEIMASMNPDTDASATPGSSSWQDSTN